MGRTMRERQHTRAIYAFTGALAASAVLALTFLLASALVPRPHAEAAGFAEPTFVDNAAVPCETPAIGWLDSKPLGRPFRRGKLRGGVQLPSEGDDFFTWDFPYGVTPNRGWRRWGADGTIRIVLEVLCDFRAANPGAPRIGIADISRPRGGKFGARFGGLGHASHQNGLDVDILYPRSDLYESTPTHPSQINRALAQDLVDRFVAAGAEYVFVGLGTRLVGPKGIVTKIGHHDDHLHVRIPRPLATGTPPPAALAGTGG